METPKNDLETPQHIQAMVPRATSKSAEANLLEKTEEEDLGVSPGPSTY